MHRTPEDCDALLRGEGRDDAEWLFRWADEVARNAALLGSQGRATQAMADRLRRIARRLRALEGGGG